MRRQATPTSPTEALLLLQSLLSRQVALPAAWWCHALVQLPPCGCARAHVRVAVELGHAQLTPQAIIVSNTPAGSKASL